MACRAMLLAQIYSRNPENPGIQSFQSIQAGLDTSRTMCILEVLGSQQLAKQTDAKPDYVSTEVC